MIIGRKHRTGPDDRQRAWDELAAALGGEVIPGRRRRDDSVRIPHGRWTIIVDLHVVSTGQATVTLTRVRSYYAGRRELTVTVRRKNLFDKLGVLLGRGEGPAAARALTGRYVVKARPESRLSSFLGGALVEEILRLPSLRLDVKRPTRKSRKRYGEDAGVVVCQTTGVIVDPDRLRGMTRVVGETLEALARIGEALREAPADRG